MNVFFAKSSLRLLYCWYALLTWSSSVAICWGINPVRLNSFLSVVGKAEPLLKHGVFKSADPTRAQSCGPLVLNSRCPNFGWLSWGLSCLCLEDMAASDCAVEQVGIPKDETGRSSMVRWPVSFFVWTCGYQILKEMEGPTLMFKSASAGACTETINRNDVAWLYCTCCRIKRENVEVSRSHYWLLDFIAPPWAIDHYWPECY